MPRAPLRAAFDELRRSLRSALKGAVGDDINLVKRTNVVVSVNSGQEGSEHFAEAVQVAPVRQKRRER
jgi:hypothetical protein